MKRYQSTDDSCLKLVLQCILALLIWSAALLVAAGTAHYLFRLLYGIDIPNSPNSRVLLLISIALVILASCSCVYSSRIGKLKLFRNLLIHSLGLLCPFIVVGLLFVSLVTGKKQLEPLDAVVVLVSAAVFHVARSFSVKVSGPKTVEHPVFGRMQANGRNHDWYDGMYTFAFQPDAVIVLLDADDLADYDFQ
ncbi:MAG: hypothetical protein GY794_05535, partial [bacterium]|nr:hypothetical protein [bacterium]